MTVPLDAPIRFTPLFMERVWGGRRLEELYGKPLPTGRPIGESWELSDRPGEQSVVADGPLAGATLHELWTDQREAIFGRAGALGESERFPLLVKLLDAREALSLQVHPPPEVAPELGGDPKSEAWVVAAADPGAFLYAGVRRGVDRAAFEAALRDGGDVAALLHRFEVRDGDALVVPSGRVHAIGPGNVIVEVQQSSDTTYRVYDFGRMGLDGAPRELHVEQSLRSIDFGDVEPEPVRGGGVVTEWEHFTLRTERVDGTALRPAPDGECAIVAVVGGRLACGAATLRAGDVVLVPAAGAARELTGSGNVVVALLPGSAEGDR